MVDRLPADGYCGSSGSGSRQVSSSRSSAAITLIASAATVASAGSCSLSEASRSHGSASARLAQVPSRMEAAIPPKLLLSAVRYGASAVARRSCAVVDGRGQDQRRLADVVHRGQHGAQGSCVGTPARRLGQRAPDRVPGLRACAAGREPRWSQQPPVIVVRVSVQDRVEPQALRL